MSARADTEVRPYEMGSEGALATDGWRSAGRSNGQKNAASDRLERHSTTGIVETGGTGRRERINPGADDARRACGAMLGGFEMAKDIVMLELPGQQEEGVERYAEERARISRPASHSVDDITARR